MMVNRQFMSFFETRYKLADKIAITGYNINP